MDKLWFKKPAKIWRNALPLGNGITGIMVFGGKRKEKLCFNDSTLWSGYPKNYNSCKSAQNLNKARELIFGGKAFEAQKLIEAKLCGFYSESFLPLARVKLKLYKISGCGYSRKLDLSNALHTVKTNGITRECFVSYPDKTGIYKIRSDRPFDLKISGDSKLKYSTVFDGAYNIIGNAPDYVAPNYLIGEKNPIKYNEKKGMSYCLRTEIQSDGEIKFHKKFVTVSNAKEVTLYFATATGFKRYNEMPVTDRNYPLQKCKELLDNLDKNYDEIKQRHINDYKNLFNRQKLSLCDESDLPTDKLVKLAKKHKAPPALTELFYNFGKYMMIEASRKGGQAMNLQGLWNNSRRPPWSSNYTANINVQMNYWAMGSLNLADCLPPYIDMVYEAVQNGRKTAEINYNCKGFACNHNVDIWRKTPPVIGSASYMYSPLCGVWLANEIFALYQNNDLSQYTDKVYEILHAAAEFANSYLILHNDKYVICPSTSPENSYCDNGIKAGVDYSTAFDTGLVLQCFDNYLSVFDDSLADEIKEKSQKLYGFTIGKNGLNEWHSDFDEPEKGHRHFSPLYAFYPARVIKYHENKELTKAVKERFQFRLQNAHQPVGWSAAWAICIAARLHDGKTCKSVIDGMFAKSIFPNLFDVCVPKVFQIDGNLGFIAGVNEMLVYYENEIYDILPAIPQVWQNGYVKGIVSKNSVIDIKWQNGIITEINSDKPIVIRKTEKITALTKLGKNVEILEAKYE